MFRYVIFFLWLLYFLSSMKETNRKYIKRTIPWSTQLLKKSSKIIILYHITYIDQTLLLVVDMYRILQSLCIFEGLLQKFKELKYYNYQTRIKPIKCAIIRYNVGGEIIIIKMHNNPMF